MKNNNQNYGSQINRDNNQARNTKDANANPQRSPENGRESNVPDSASGSDKVNQADIEIGKRLENQDAENTNTVPNPAERISDAEDFNDENIDHAIDKANNRIPQHSSRKANRDAENNDDDKERESIDAGTNPDRNAVDNTRRSRDPETGKENNDINNVKPGSKR
jgi:hypothetical protein